MNTEDVLRAHTPAADWHCKCGEDLFGGSAAYSYELYLSHVAGALMNEGEWIREERWVPVTETGVRWAGRSHEAAEATMRDYPVGGEYASGDPWDGIARIVHEVRYVTDWTERDA